MFKVRNWHLDTQGAQLSFTVRESNVAVDCSRYSKGNLSELLMALKDQTLLQKGLYDRAN